MIEVDWQEPSGEHVVHLTGEELFMARCVLAPMSLGMRPHSLNVAMLEVYRAGVHLKAGARRTRIKVDDLRISGSPRGELQVHLTGSQLEIKLLRLLTGCTHGRGVGHDWPRVFLSRVFIDSHHAELSLCREPTAQAGDVLRMSGEDA